MSHRVSVSTPTRLRYVSDRLLTITRLGKPGRFLYRQGSRSIRRAAEVKRFQSLAIPPAWTDVRICSRANGHLQAVGRDARGRKQYLYHPRWREIRDRKKFAHLMEFGQSLRQIRARVRRDLRQRSIAKSKVLAAVVRLLDLTHIRVGNEEYVRQNDSFGLTTLRDPHVKIQGSLLCFSYRGKSGKNHKVHLRDAQLARIVANCKDIPGQELFQYLNDDGRRRSINSTDVNRYLQEISGGDFTAKDFRTWAGTVLMARALRTSGHWSSQKEARSKVATMLQAVAENLGNTAAICRKSYVHPELIEMYLQHGHSPKGLKEIHCPTRKICGLTGDEATVMCFLQNRS